MGLDRPTSRQAVSGMVPTDQDSGVWLAGTYSWDSLPFAFFEYRCDSAFPIQFCWSATTKLNVRGTKRQDATRIKNQMMLICDEGRYQSDEPLFLKQQEQQNGRGNNLGYVHWWTVGMHTSEFCKEICNLSATRTTTNIWFIHAGPTWIHFFLKTLSKMVVDSLFSPMFVFYGWARVRFSSFSHRVSKLVNFDK